MPAPAPFAAALGAPVCITSLWLVVHPRGDEDDSRSQDKCDRHLEIEKRDRRHEGNNDAQARRKTLENVIRVFDHKRREEAA